MQLQICNITVSIILYEQVHFGSIFGLQLMKPRNSVSWWRKSRGRTISENKKKTAISLQFEKE